ncbi:hypothetical protein TNCV_4112441 [Trichonephila clavipes]|nr:hypothetical protein TNCV_4112441 [Trichonephila clavipes]
MIVEWPRWPSGQRRARSQCVMNLSRGPLKTRRVEWLCYLNLSRIKRLAVCVVWKLAEKVPTQVSSSPLEHVTKLRDS